MNRPGRGFTLIEILIVLAVIGIIAAIAIPNLLNALQRGRQKRTMSDIRAIGSACETYAIDNDEHVDQPLGGDVQAIAPYLEPTYISIAPRSDAWGSSVEYVGADRNYTLTSLGRDRLAGGGGTVSGDGTTTDFANDIVFASGAFIQYPGTEQR